MTINVPEAAAHPPVPYGTPEAPRIAVRGEAHLEADPETATIYVTVRARGGSRRSALDDLTRRNVAVLDLVKAYPDAVESLETGSFSIRPEFSKQGRGERVRSYHGHVRIIAEFTDFTALGELITRLADLEFTEVNGPMWALRQTSPVHREARKQAVREAVQRAREYAEALGTTLAALVEVADTGVEQPVPYGYSPSPGGAFGVGRGAGAGEAAPLDLEPQRQSVHAQVVARFTMVPPQL